MPRKPATPKLEAATLAVMVFNCVPHTTLHLGDGRTLLHGEGAEVTPELAKLLRDRGQAE